MGEKNGKKFGGAINYTYLYQYEKNDFVLSVVMGLFIGEKLSGLGFIRLKDFQDY